ncbi:hypothetical protein D3C85_1500030 [compost metagenome]
MGNGARALARIGSEGGNIDQADDVGHVAHLGDHGAAVGVTDQQHGTGLLRHHLAGSLGVVGQRGQGQLNRLQLGKTVSKQLGDDSAPVHGAAPKAVNQNDGGLFVHGAVLLVVTRRPLAGR